MGHIDGAEIAKHSTKKSCWIVLDSKAYDVTNFVPEHPGGAVILLQHAGTVSIRDDILGSHIDH
jgi:L-lactate dehydrogenase (cytochrome)